jgi:2,6-dihydroxypyridine 3-monooxygenase
VRNLVTPANNTSAVITPTDSLGSVVIVGGSIGGLTAAVLLHDAGFDVTVLERSSTHLKGRGAGIVLHEATARYLIERAGMSLGAISEGARWFRFVDRAGTVTYEAECLYRFTAWSSLYVNLLDHLPPNRYRLGNEVVGLEETGDRIRVVIGDQGFLTADLVVCAEGITSTTRRLLLPEIEPRYAGYLGWRGVVRESELDLTVFDRLYEAITYSTPHLSHVLAYPIPNNTGPNSERIINYVWYRNLAEGTELDDTLTDVAGERRTMSVAPGLVQGRHIAYLRREAEEVLPVDLAQLVLTTELPFIQTVVDVEVPRMAFGRVCLIGDAAFASRPHAAAGTAKAAADGWDLTASLLAAGGDVIEGLRSWEPRALERGRRLVDRSRRLGTMAQVEGRFGGGDPYIMFGLDQPGDSCYPPSKPYGRL